MREWSNQSEKYLKECLISFSISILRKLLKIHFNAVELLQPNKKMSSNSISPDISPNAGNEIVYDQIVSSPRVVFKIESFKYFSRLQWPQTIDAIELLINYYFVCNDTVLKCVKLKP